MVNVEIKRGYEVLPDNNIRFGIRITNVGDLAISDVEVILDYSESLFKLEGDRLHKVGVIPPAGTRTAEFILKPLGCVHNVNIEALISFRDAKYVRQRIDMHPKEVHCVCPFLKGKAMPRAEFLKLSSSGHSAESGLNFKGVSVERLASYLVQTCKSRHHKVDDYSVDGGRMLYLASESIGEKAYYLLTALIKEDDGLTQVMLRVASDKLHGLNGFLNEIVADLRHVASSVQSAQEIGIIKKEQVINIIDSIVQRSSFGGVGGEGGASVNVQDSVVKRTEFNVGEGEEAEETFTVLDNKWDIEIKLTEAPINGYFFNISKKYQHLIQEGDIDIINDSGETMHCNTVASMGKGRITKNLNNWYKMKKFQPDDRFYLKKLDDKKFKVVSIRLRHEEVQRTGFNAGDDRKVEEERLRKEQEEAEIEHKTREVLEEKKRLEELRKKQDDEKEMLRRQEAQRAENERKAQEISAWQKQKARDEQERITKKKSKTRTNVFMLAVVFALLFGFVMFTSGSGGIHGASSPQDEVVPEPIESISVLSSDQKTYTNFIGIEFVLIPAGEFDMGSLLVYKDMPNYVEPVHKVNIPDDFYLGKYEVTNKQWREIMGDNPNWKVDNLPIEGIQWYDIQEFIQKLNEKEGTDKYRLPSEAEWEYACRAGTTTRYSFGDDMSKLDEYTWNDGRVHPVGQKKPNPWGLYDMYGNGGFEWVQDSWHSDYNGAPVDGSAWEGESDLRVVRGVTSALRGFGEPGANTVGISFRLLKEM